MNKENNHYKQFTLIDGVNLQKGLEITIVRNNEFKNYINMPAEGTDRVVVYLSIDLKESLTRVEDAIEQELPQIQDGLCELVGEEIKLKYRGVQGIEENGIKLSFAVFCKGKYYGWIRRLLSHDLLLMCERNENRLAMPQIVVNERELPKAETGT